MQQQKGFTLIELVVVIIILGILAVTAAPKFINLQTDARASALQGVKGAIQGANSLVYSKASLKGEQNKPTATLDILGTTDVKDDVSIVYGYMAATPEAIYAGTDIDKNDWKVESYTAPASGRETTSSSVRIHQAGAPESGKTCNVIYTAAAEAGALPIITVDKEGC
ncbi:MAG: type II secretion system protein [Shewanella sp.]